MGSETIRNLRYEADYQTSRKEMTRVLKPFDLQALSIFLCIKVALVTDPACGTSGFLVAASDYLKENKKSEVFFNKENREHYLGLPIPEKLKEILAQLHDRSKKEGEDDAGSE